MNKMIPFFRIFTAFISAVSLLVFPLFAAVSFRELDLPDDFKTESSSCTLDYVAESKEPGFLKFHLSAPHAFYDVEGLVTLKKTLREIEVIEEGAKGAGANYAGGIGDSVKAMGVGLYRLVRHPINSVRGIGKATGKTAQRVGDAFGKREEGEKTGWGEAVMGGTKREIAKKLGLDVYSRNPEVQALLDRSAKARLAGAGTFFVGTFFIPGGPIVSAAITATGVNEAADRLVNDQSREELFHVNKNALVQLGFLLEESLKLLNSSFYTPREVTYIRFYLEALWKVRGNREVLERASSAKSDWQARKILYEAQIAALAVSENLKPLRVQCLDEGLVFETAARSIFITPYDYLEDSPLGERVLDRGRELKRGSVKNSFEIWNGGKVAGKFSSKAASAGIKVREWLLFREVGSDSVGNS